VTARLLNGGILWEHKQQGGILDDVRVRVDLRREWASHWPFGAPDLRTSFHPHREAIETTDGQPVEELLQPRDSFKGHSFDTPWTRLQFAYFVGYVKSFTAKSGPPAWKHLPSWYLVSSNDQMIPPKAHRFGYARVSSVGQNLDSQVDALQKAECEKIFSDKTTGSRMDRILAAPDGPFR
jgi:hypothetical protein